MCRLLTCSQELINKCRPRLYRDLKSRFCVLLKRVTCASRFTITWKIIAKRASVLRVHSTKAKAVAAPWWCQTATTLGHCFLVNKHWVMLLSHAWRLTQWLICLDLNSWLCSFPCRGEISIITISRVQNNHNLSNVAVIKWHLEPVPSLWGQLGWIAKCNRTRKAAEKKPDKV